ncbi:MAG: DNA cytosine methyltransferase [Bacteroidota bacterium]
MPRKNSYITATDQFCGAGGSSTGAVNAGVEVKMALNHWKLAIETHNTNHPNTDHDCTDVQACDPRRYPSTDILITSPECTNHSLAKGGKRKSRNQFSLFGGNEITPEQERSRATMWDVPRFAEYHDYNIVIVENVVDARYWRLWNAWLQAMHDLGYQHKCCYLNSMFFHPCPQSRDRMYVVFWKKGNKAPDLEFRPKGPCKNCGTVECYQSWKKSEKKWGKYKQQYLYRCSKCNEIVTPFFYCAMNVIDWSVPITRIGDRKKPLAEKTIARIKYGLEKHAGKQLIITNAYSSGIGCRVRDSELEPMPTQTGDPKHYLLSTIQIGRSAYEGNPTSVSLPMNTQTTRQDAYVLLPSSSIVELRGTSKSRSSDEAISTFTAGGINHALLVGNYSPGWVRTLEDPTGTMTCTAQQSLLSHKALNSFLTYYYGTYQQSNMADAINTITTIDRSALVQPDIKVEDCYYRCLKAHEVQRAMSFADDYIVLGNSKQKVKQLGNAVTPPVMEWLSKRCVESLTN